MQVCVGVSCAGTASAKALVGGHTLCTQGPVQSEQWVGANVGQPPWLLQGCAFVPSKVGEL